MKTPTTLSQRFTNTRTLALGAALAAAGLLSACASFDTSGPRGTAALQAKSGSKVAGNVWFTQRGDQVRVVARISGLTPNQQHGFHVHEKGDCSSADGLSAGGHFNPMNHPHGPQNMPHHGGDMPSLKADGLGNAEAEFLLTGVTVGSGATDLLGRAVIVHAKPDDYTTQPTGDAGGRIACGVIAAVAP